MDRYVIREGAERLRILASSGRSNTEAFWDRIGVEAGYRCVDIGCGPGFVSLELARRVGPDGYVHAFDRDPAAIAAAREEQRATGVANIEFVVADAYALALPAGIDLAYSRLLLQHLSRPAEVLRAMWASVSPGGVLAIEDADFEGGFSEPPDAGYEFWRERYSELLVRGGGDPVRGRRLVGLFLDAGLPRPSIDVRQHVATDGAAKLLPVMTLEATAAAMVEAGVATTDEVAAAADVMRRFAADPTTLVGGPRHFQAWVRQPFADE